MARLERQLRYRGAYKKGETHFIVNLEIVHNCLSEHCIYSQNKMWTWGANYFIWLHKRPSQCLFQNNVHFPVLNKIQCVRRGLRLSEKNGATRCTQVLAKISCWFEFEYFFSLSLFCFVVFLYYSSFYLVSYTIKIFTVAVAVKNFDWCVKMKITGFLMILTVCF